VVVSAPNRLTTKPQPPSRPAVMRQPGNIIPPGHQCECPYIVIILLV
jgi:hypothetical protein